MLTYVPADTATPGRALLRQGLEASHHGRYVALQTLVAASERFAAERDPHGVALCAAALMLTGQAFVSYRGFPDHIAALAGLRDGSLRFADSNEDLLAHTGLLAGLLMFSPGDPFCKPCADRILALLELELDVNLKFAAGRAVLYYTEPREARETGHRAYALLQPLMDRTDLTPYRLGRWLMFWATAAGFAKEKAQCERAKAQALALATRYHDPQLSIWLAVTNLNAALEAGDFDRVDSAMAIVERMSDPANLNDMRRLAWLKARSALAQGEGDTALFHAVRSRKYAQELELPPPMLGVCMALEAQAHLLAGNFDRARELFRETAAAVAELHSEEMRDMIRMVDAYEALREGRDDGRELLAAAFAAPRARQFYDSFDGNPRFGATMCALALEHDVEVAFVRRVVELNALRPPPEAGPSWPWAVKVTTLGRFELACAGKVVRELGKPQRKPRELLKALIAFGGRAVSKPRLTDLLWPDVEGDGASAALNMAVSRLRKLLGDPEALVIEHGRIGLDPTRVWIDVWAFDATVEALQSEWHGRCADETVALLGNRLLNLYRGSFLESEPAEPWLLPARDRWRNRFLRSLCDVGAHWQRRERWADAAQVYERAIEIDMLGENVYQALMRCHLAQGRTAEAAGVYRRCREALRTQLGSPPSPSTEALFQSIDRH